MTEAQIILKMIESVDPADTVKLDEIDARVEEYVSGRRAIFSKNCGWWRNETEGTM
jgi:hypothetical protein